MPRCPKCGHEWDPDEEGKGMKQKAQTAQEMLLHKAEKTQIKRELRFGNFK